MYFINGLARGLLSRLGSKYQIAATRHLYCRMVTMKNNNPIISFSFDDAPRTAFTNGGDVLNAHEVKATCFISLGMLGSDSPSGIIASLADLRNAFREGHELGCHTFDHRHPRNTKTDVFERSVFENRQALSRLLPEASFRTLAYPICGPRPLTKLRIGKLFDCCRIGGQKFNAGKIDLNLVRGFSLDMRAGVSIDTVKLLIDRNCESNGWLVFYTHDVQDQPSSYGCHTEFFKEVVMYSAASGAHLLPVSKACEHVTK